MGETNPYQSEWRAKLFATRLQPQAARTVLWFAAYRIMDEKCFAESDRKQAGVYLETIFGALDSIERQDAEFASRDRHPVATLLDMGGMMTWASTEVKTAGFPHGYEASGGMHQNEDAQTRLNLGIIENHLGTAYQKYLEYQDIRARDAAWLGIRWF